MRSPWTEATVRAEAAKYSSKKDFERGSPRAYEHAQKRLKIINELFDNQRSVWNLETLMAEAAKYPGKIEFKRANNPAYKAALRLGVIAKLGFVDKQVTWTEPMVRDAAKGYKNLIDLLRNNNKLYAAARRFGINGDLGLARIDGKDNDTIYIWRAVGQYFNGEPVYKIGVTSARLGDLRIKHVANGVGFEFVLICHVKVRCRATEIEKRLHLLGYDPEYVGFDGATEFRAMDDATLWVALGLISEVIER